MRPHLPVLAGILALGMPATALAKTCSDGRTYLASQPCPKKNGGKVRPTFLPTDRSNLPKYRADLADFRAQAADDLAAGKLTQAQYDRKLGQYHQAMAELNARPMAK